MTTPQWTVDEDGRLSWAGEPAGFGYIKLPPDRYAALVADVAAARLVDDMAAERDQARIDLEEALRKAQRPGSVLAQQHSDGTWMWLWQTEGGGIGHEEASPGEVAALHHARQEEELEPKCICRRFRDTGGYRIADLACPVHGVGGTNPGDGPWEDESDSTGEGS